MTPKKKYKLSITNLAFVANNYPFDFFFRIRQNHNGNYYDSSMIDMQTFECTEDFPWEFTVSQDSLTIQFIQLPTSKSEIIRANQALQSQANGDVQLLQMIGNRTGKKICVLQYILEPIGLKQQSNDKIQSDYSKYSQNSHQNHKKVKQSNNNPTQKSQLTNQIKNIKQQMQRIVNQSKQQHQKFTKYLDQSSNYIEQLLNNKDDKKKSTQEIKQNQKQDKYNQNKAIDMKKKIIRDKKDELEKVNAKSKTQTRWFQEKFGKQLTQNQNKRMYINNSDDALQEFEPMVSFSQSYQQSLQNIQFDDISLSTQIKPNEIIVSRPHNSEISLVDNLQTIVTMKSPIEYGYKWKRSLQLPAKIVLCIEVKDCDNEISLFGCIGRMQIQNKIVYLFDKQGKDSGYIRFKCKPVQTLSVQTVDVLNMELNRSVEDVKEEEKYNFQYLKEQSNSKKKEDDDKVYYSKDQFQYCNNIDEESSKKFSVWRNSQVSQYEDFDKYQKSQRKSNFQYEAEKCEILNPTYLEKNNSSNSRRKKQFNINNHQVQLILNENEKKIGRSTRSIFYPKISRSMEKSRRSFNLSEIDLKFSTISVKLLSKINKFSMKFLKIYVKGSQQIQTQPLPLNSPLVWKGKDYIIPNISPFDELIIDLYALIGESIFYEGSAKISLTLLTLDKGNKICFYHQYIRGQDMCQIGQLIIGYQNINKGKSDQINSNSVAHRQLQAITPEKRYKIKSRKRLSTNPSYPSQSSQHVQKLKKIPKNIKIGLQKSDFKPLNLYSSSVRTKKYTGGNIIIGKASRFKDNNRYTPVS